MRNPYLVQRGTIKNPAKIEGIDSLIKFDYMGAAEFEWGALPKALKEICGIFDELEMHSSNIKTTKGETLWLLCKNEDVEQLREFWSKVSKDTYSVKTIEVLWYNRTGAFDPVGNINFWWDVGENQCWMATLGHNNIVRVHEALEAVKKKKGW